MERRTALLGLIALLGAGAEGCVVHDRSVVRQRRRVRRRTRRRTRRRVRRRAAVRSIHGRNVLVVPVDMSAGWELAVASRVVVVHEVRPTSIIVSDASGGGQEEIEIVREDTAENLVEEQGTAIAENDTTTPYREVEEEVDEVDDEASA